MKLYFSIHESVAAWPRIDEYKTAVLQLIASAGIPVQLAAEMEVLPDSAVDTSSMDAATIMGNWQAVSQLRKRVAQAPNCIVIHLARYRDTDHDGHRFNKYTNDYGEIQVNMQAPHNNKGRRMMDNYFVSDSEYNALVKSCAHEFGHLCDAEHDQSEPYTVMHAGYSDFDTIPGWSQQSLTQMRGYRLINPFYTSQIAWIGNYVCHGIVGEPSDKDGYIRDGVMTFDNDPSRETYYHNPGAHPHEGTDIHMPVGTPIRSPFDGIVQSCNENSSKGKYIVLRQDSMTGYWLEFCHLDDFAVDEGQPVVMGDLIGYSGCTGYTSEKGAHCHFVVRQGSPAGRPQEPFTIEGMRQWFAGVPHHTKSGTAWPEYAWFPNDITQAATINDSFRVTTYRGSDAVYVFKAPEPILNIWHPTKTIDGVLRDNGDFDVMAQGLDGKLSGDGKVYTLHMEQKAKPGIYRFQVETAAGMSNPLIIEVKE